MGSKRQQQVEQNRVHVGAMKQSTEQNRTESTFVLSFFYTILRRPTVDDNIFALLKKPIKYHHNAVKERDTDFSRRNSKSVRLPQGAQNGDNGWSQIC